MKYLDGQDVRLGDVVELGGGMQGVVVCCLDDGECIPSFPIEKWEHLASGVLVTSPEAGLIHFPVLDVDLVLIKRGQ